MGFEDKTSDRLQVFIDAIDSDPVLWGVSPEGIQLTEMIAYELVRSREAITDNRFSTIESLLTQTVPGSIECVLDEHFSRGAVNAVRGYVKRTITLSRFEAVRLPSNVTSTFLREAIRAFILGLPLASVALSRAALEQALKEKMTYQSKGEKVGIKNLLDEAEGCFEVLDAVTRKMADEVVRLANEVLHERPTDLDEAFEVLLQLRGVLHHVYSD